MLPRDIITLLIDGDEYLFKACSVVERETRWDDENHVLTCNEREAWDNFTRLIDQLAERFETQDLVLCFSGKRPYFREAFYPAYKGGRVGRKPLCYADLRVRCEETYLVRSMVGLEADDVMGILATKPGTLHSVICSQDKDMQTVPCFRYVGGDSPVELIDTERARRFHFTQTLMGDKTDGYPGCPGMGPKRAADHLAAEKGSGSPWSWERVVEAYRRADLDEQVALEQARLAKILTWTDWDTTAKQPILWTPGRVTPVEFPESEM